MHKLSISKTIQFILLTGLLSLFFACGSSTDEGDDDRYSLQQFKETEIDSKAVDATDKLWAIPEPYTNLSVEEIKAQEGIITDYFELKGAATNAEGGRRGTSDGQEENPKSKKDREALATFTNKLISFEGVVNTISTQKVSPLDIEEGRPGQYEVWFCADKNQKRKPCRYRAHLLYKGPEGKGDKVFENDDVIRFWGVMLGEQTDVLRYAGYDAINRYPKIRVIDLEVIGKNTDK